MLTRLASATPMGPIAGREQDGGNSSQIARGSGVQWGGDVVGGLGDGKGDFGPVESCTVLDFVVGYPTPLLPFPLLWLLLHLRRGY